MKCLDKKEEKEGSGDKEDKKDRDDKEDPQGQGQGRQGGQGNDEDNNEDIRPLPTITMSIENLFQGLYKTPIYHWMKCQDNKKKKVVRKF